MKKKHRDIVVDGVQYGWTVWCNTVKLWKDKKVFAEYDIPYHHDITPKIVAGLIKDPESTMIWVNAKPCPFCGALVSESNDTFKEEYYNCNHTEDCWFTKTSSQTTWILKTDIETWSKRS